MTDEQLIFELGRRGSDLSRWPSDLQLAAKSLIATSPEAAAQCREARALDYLMLADVRAEPVLSDPKKIAALVSRIVTVPQEQARPHLTWPARAVAAKPLRYGVCIAAALMGFAVGAIDSHRSAVPIDLLDSAFGPTGDLDVQ